MQLFGGFEEEKKKKVLYKSQIVVSHMYVNPIKVNIVSRKRYLKLCVDSLHVRDSKQGKLSFLCSYTQKIVTHFSCQSKK